MEGKVAHIGNFTEPEMVRSAKIDELCPGSSSPGSFYFHKKRRQLFVRCSDGWVGVGSIGLPIGSPCWALISIMASCRLRRTGQKCLSLSRERLHPKKQQIIKLNPKLSSSTLFKASRTFAMYGSFLKKLSHTMSCAVFPPRFGAVT